MPKNKIRRIADFLEKLAVAGIALGIFQGNPLGVFGFLFLIVSLYLTKEDA